MKKYLIAASVLALSVATGANAADIVRPQPVTPVYTAPAFSWTGFYVGGQIGWAWADTDVSGVVANHTFAPDPDGFMGGIYLGYNFNFGNNFVAGIETDFAWSDIDASETVLGTLITPDVSVNVKQKWEGATRVRLGYDADRFLPYIAGGVAYTKVKTSVNAIDNLGNVASLGTGDKTLVGWTVGAGVDYAVTDNLLLRLEYRYSDFGDKDYSVEGGKFNTDYKTNDVRVGVAYKF